MRWSFAALLVALLLVLSGCISAPSPSTPTASQEGPTPTSDGTTSTPSSTATETPSDTATPTDTPPEPAPPDPETDRLGWENGYWYNSSVAVTPADGLNESELDAVISRAMARIEHIRALEFEEDVPVEVISRAEFRNRTGGRNISPANRLHQNVKWEAMFMIGETEDALATQESNQGATVGGYYSPAQDQIVIVSENATTPKMNEVTLAHELFHALQEHHFEVSEYDQSTRELHNAKDGIIEGDSSYVERLYDQHCSTEWDCVLPSPTEGGGSSSIHWGMYLVTYQPYSDGPSFVNQIHQRGGWDAVNAVYENPPESTEQTIHPERYPDDEPAELSFSDRSDDEWAILDLQGGINYASFGEAGLATMLFYPFYDSGRTEAPIVPLEQFFNFTSDGSLSTDDPITYTTPYTVGWDGDWLYPYVNESSAATNETGYVWKTVWDSPDDAREFGTGYEQLLLYHDAEVVADGVYRIPQGPYADAFSISIEENTVYVVNAPTVADLDSVRAGAGP